MRSTDHTPSLLDDKHHASGHDNLHRAAHYVGDQLAQFQPRMLLVRALLAPLPNFMGGHVRAAVLRAVGFDIGGHSGFQGTPRIYGRGNICKLLKIGSYTWINISCHLDLSASITIGNRVGIGPEVMIMTGTHEMGPEHERVGRYIAHPVTIGDGVWIGARCTIMPGVTIGRGSVISAGTVVTRDVPPNTVLSGTQRMPFDKWVAFTKNGTHGTPAAGAGS